MKKNVKVGDNMREFKLIILLMCFIYKNLELIMLKRKIVIMR